MNQELKQLQEQVYRRNQVLSIKQKLKMQIGELKAKLEQLQKIKTKEELDLERLEKPSLRMFLADLAGRKEDKLNKERQEAYDAAMKYEAAATELAVLERDLAAFDKELLELDGCEDRYREALNAQESYYMEHDPVRGPKLHELEDKLVDLQCRKKEVSEAIQAGEKALQQTKIVFEELDKAQGWSTFDLIGGGLITDIQKHKHMDHAQDEIEHLQVLLRRFKNELSDVGEVIDDLKVNVDGFLKFADYFFDDIFSAWSIRSKIKDSNERIIEITHRIEAAQSRLKSVLSQLDREERVTEQEIKNILIE